MKKWLLAILPTMALLEGCLLSAPMYGPAGYAYPDSDQYRQYLDYSIQHSPAFARKCEEWGQPDIIQIGHSGAYFGWKDPPHLISIKYFGLMRTWETSLPHRQMHNELGLSSRNRRGGRAARAQQESASAPAVQRTEHHVKAMDYNPSTRKGVIEVVIGSDGYESARKFARRNIETIVKDKNIALVTGQAPTQARYFIGAEKVLDGEVLRIEFETE